MRCISPHSRYSVQVIEGDERIAFDSKNGSATSVVLSKPIIADFQQGGIMPHEYEAALRAFSFSGVPEGVNPLTRLSHFDTEAYANQLGLKEDVVEAIEERFRLLAQLNPSQFIIVDKPPAIKPWPTYDDDSEEEILESQEKLGFKPELIRLYEYENKARKAILTAMEEREAEALGEETILVSA